MEMKPLNKLKLYGFNNLTKTLSFNMYDIVYAKSAVDQKDYIKYIDEHYNAHRLTAILEEVSHMIGANILNIASQDYDPQGASVTMLVAEEELVPEVPVGEHPGPRPDAVVAHLDKSHVTVHTYPESHPDNGISTFRVDIDVSTCGKISPLRALNYLLHTFNPDIANVDYRVRGFTRDVRGKKHFIDHKINSIQNYIDKDMQAKYQMIDVNVYQENIFHTKMLLADFDLDNYLFNMTEEDLGEKKSKAIRRQLQKEMSEIFYSKNIPI